MVEVNIYFEVYVYAVCMYVVAWQAVVAFDVVSSGNGFAKETFKGCVVVWDGQQVGCPRCEVCLVKLCAFNQHLCP